MQKSLYRKLADIHANPATSRAFILADAKDADMAHGLRSPGSNTGAAACEKPAGCYRSLAEYRQLMRDVTRQGLVDIMLMSASSNEVLTIEERIFDGSSVTPAARANDTTDIHVVRGGKYTSQPSRPFRTATIDQIQCGKVDCTADERRLGADLGLYSMTFTNDTELDRETLLQYRDFRIEAERKGFRHFLEVFDPNVPGAVPPDELPLFIADHIARVLAGVPRRGRPIFLKIAYHGPAAMEALVNYAPDLVPGILGGAAGTTFDAFHQLWEAKKYGARAALYGRKINNSEHQLAFIEFLHRIANDEIGPEEAVRAYHGVLQSLKIQPQRELDDDLQLTIVASSYAGSAQEKKKAVVTKPEPTSSNVAQAPGEFRELSDEEIGLLSRDEKIDYNLRRMDHLYGRQ
ncbi:MAG: hypothetical protein ACR2IE_04560 [Candidatus Sumerlaeaceae bacterium]